MTAYLPRCGRLEHGLEVMTADTDFARFPGVRWCNPLT